jgi:hypothetical protein
MIFPSTDMKTIDPRRATLVAWSNSTRLVAFCLATAGLGLSAGIAQTPGSELPTGYADIAIAAGSGAAKRTTLVSIPMLEDVPSNLTGSKTGRITGVTSNTITVANANWTAGALSTAATPYLMEITSGAALGHMLLVSTATANTADTVTIDSSEVSRVGNLTALGITADAATGDTFRLWPCDTLGSFFGTPETTGIQGGSSTTAADTVVLVINGSAMTYFYNTTTTPPRWSRAGINSDASNVAIPPYAGVQYSRLGATPLAFRTLGRMPVGSRKVAIRNSGTTILSPYWPVNQTLSSLGLHNLPGWQSGTSSTTADTVVLTSNGTATTYYYDGTNWRRAGINSNANSVAVPPGASLLINKRGSASGFAIYQHTAPYSSE